MCIDTSTIEGKIAVMQAFKEGKKIEYKYRIRKLEPMT